MNIEGLEAGDVGTMLDVDHNVATRTGLHCAPLVHEQLGTVPIHGAVRFSVGAFNTEAHIDAAVEGVRQIARWSKERQAKRAAAAPVHARIAMTALLYISLYASVACFVFGCLRRVRQYASLPLHLRWELYPVPHEPPERANARRLVFRRE